MDDDHYVLERLVHGIDSLDQVEDACVEMDETFADRDRLNAALLLLPPRLERAVRLRYGFGGYGCDGPMTFAEIGEVFGVTQNRAVQMVAQAQRKMFRFLHASRRVTPEEQYDLNQKRAMYEAQERAVRERYANWQKARAAQARAERDLRAVEIEQAMEVQCQHNLEGLARSQEREAGLSPLIAGFAPPNRCLVQLDKSSDIVCNKRLLPATMRRILEKSSEMIDFRFPLLMLWVPVVAGLMLVLKPDAAVSFFFTFLVVIWAPWELMVFQRFGMFHHRL